MVAAAHEPRARTQLMICVNTTAKPINVASLLIVVRRLTRRPADDIERIVVEYGIDAIRELDVAPGSFTEANRAWAARHEASSFAAIEVATLRIVARNAGNVYRAAARLGCPRSPWATGSTPRPREVARPRPRSLRLRSRCRCRACGRRLLLRPLLVLAQAGDQLVAVADQ